MKKNQVRAFLQLAIVLLVAGFSSIAQAATVVQLSVNSNQDALDVTTRGQCANEPNNDGCVRASGRMNINFNLKNARCDDGSKWELSHVALGNGNKVEPGGISAVAAADFNADQTSGIVTPETQSKKHILIRNYNSQAYDIWYTVYARCAGSDEMIATDPRVENDGTGHP